MLAFPFYLMSRSPGKQGSHYDPKADLFIESEEPLVSTSGLPLSLALFLFLGAMYTWPSLQQVHATS